ncbi:MAG: hypothetical protein IIZ39_06480, partial [Blautia sp.]|nr:hypothetical protein [Blautia sp.]
MKLCFQLSKEEVSLSRMMMEAGEVAFAHKAHLENIISLRDQMDAWQQEERGEEECLEIFEEEANALVSCITVFQLLLREKKTILLHRYGIELSNEEWGRLKTIMDPSLSGEEYQEKISILQKKLTTRKKRERRNLYISDCHFYHRNMLTQMDMRPF